MHSLIDLGQVVALVLIDKEDIPRAGCHKNGCL